MRPMFRPGLSWAWRSDDSIHVGIDGPHPVVISGVPNGTDAAFALMDGTRTLDELLNAVNGSVPGLPEMIARLTEVGAVIDGGSWPGGRRIAKASRTRLLPDLMAAAPADPDHWWTSLAETHVVVVGASRLGSVIACALASVGFGRVTVDDRRKVAEGDVCNGGFTQAEVGLRRCELLTARDDLEAMESSIRPSRKLYVVTDAVDIDARTRSLTGHGSTHLVVSSRDRMGRVGPFVIPAQTACMFCVHLHHRDHDPAWPQVWRQLSWDATPITHSITVAITANLAVSHVLTWATSGNPPSMRGIIDVDGPHGTSQFRSTPPHPECGCTWVGAGAS